MKRRGRQGRPSMFRSFKLFLWIGLTVLGALLLIAATKADSDDRQS